ncbi:MAG: DoxX family protein [Gemmatimonadaceae bacterium]
MTGPMPTASIARRWRQVTPQLQSVLRMAAAFLFMQSGTMKLFGFPMPMPGGMQLTLHSQVGIAGMLEVFGGALMFIGLFTRPVAFILAGEMAVAYFQFHAPRGFWTLMNGGADAVFFCFTWLYFSAAGAGAWSLDARRKA